MAHDSDAEEEVKLTINKAFARRFEEKNRRDDLMRAKERGVLAGDSDSDEDEDEDEDGEALTAKLDFDIMKTISLIRKKDERIYDKEFRPFPGGEQGSGEPEQDDADDEALATKDKPLRYKDYVRQKVMAKVDDEDDDDDGAAPGDTGDQGDDDEGVGRRGPLRDDVPQTYTQGQEALKEAFKRAVAKVEGELNEQASDGPEDEESDGGVLKLKPKSASQLKKEEDDFKRYLSSLSSKDKSIRSSAKKEDVSLLESLFSEPAKDKNEEFLRKFVLNEGWVDRDRTGAGFDDEQDEDDLEAVEEADRYEAKYNFRFEEPGADTIAQHPRHDPTVLRRKENSRKRQRDEKKRRKQEEKQRAQEELRRLKNLKRKELESRLERSLEVAGIKKGALAFKPEDLDEDFDPDEWDKKMAATFNDDYYNEDDEGFDVDELGKDEADYVDQADSQGGAEAPGAGSAAAPADAVEDSSGTKKSRKKKRKRGGVLVVDEDDDDDEEGEGEYKREDQGRRKADPFEEELYKLDYEDIIADGLKTRFRYRKVEPNSYGLSTEEILAADNKLLQSFVSVKRMATYRDEEWHASTKHRRRFRQALKEQLAKRAGTLTKNKSKKPEAIGVAAVAAKADGVLSGDVVQNAQAAQEAGADGADADKKKRKRKRKVKSDAHDETKSELGADKAAGDTSARSPAIPAEEQQTRDSNDDGGAKKGKRKRKRKSKDQ